MTTGLDATLTLLTTTDNEAAVPVLVPALDSPFGRIRHGALRAILARRSVAGHREVLRRLHLLDEGSAEILRQHPGRLTAAIREALVSEEEQLCANACRAMVWFRQYDLIALLLGVLEDSSDDRVSLAARTLGQMIDLLDEELTSPSAVDSRRDPQVTRSHVLTALEHSVGRLTKHKRREVVETFVQLTHRDNPTLRQILQTPYHPAFLAVMETLAKSCHPGVMSLLLSFLDDPKAPSAALSVLSKRTDLKFVHCLLRKVGREPSAPVAANLKRIDALAWPRLGRPLLDQLDDMGQHAAVRTVMASGIARAEAFGVVADLLLYGKPAGRRAAAQAIEGFQGADANALAMKALDDHDPQVQAHIVVQLRGRGIPGTLPRLVEMLDSRHAVVRKAARKALAEFDFPRFLAAFDMLDDEVRRSTGLLVKKIDPQTLPLLREELESPVRTRRLRAVAIVRAIDSATELEASLIRLLSDEESDVRAGAAAALAACPSAAGREALEEALGDRSTAVREAAQKALDEQAEFLRWRETLSETPHKR